MSGQREEPMDELTRLRRRVLQLETELETERTSLRPDPAEDRFRKLFEHSNDAIFFVDALRDEILDANPSACRMLGYSRAELLSVPMSMIHPHEMGHVASRR